jgi:hypothetical protein
MKHLSTFGFILLASLPDPASAAVRAVFVGIDSYAWSQTRRPASDFKDLHGAVNDARNMKETLRTVYAIDFDRDVEGKCATANALSTTLINECATRKAIFEAWRKQIAASAKGDTLILYYAGHGSQFIDNQVFDQASGYNDTILPHDARAPDARVEAEILDREIKAVIDGATARGVNVVSIFDSCNSGTVTRDGPAEGESRAAPRRRVPGVVAVGPAAAPGPGGGYRVHFAASADGEEAREVGAIGQRAGVFTTALAAAFRAMPGAAFADIATEVRLKVGERGHVAQHPQAEGALTASLGGAERPVPLFGVSAEGGRVWLEGGQLTGVTAGSTFALYPTTSAALDDTAQAQATAKVALVEPTRAALELATGSLPAISPGTVAREIQHAFGEQALLIRNGAAPGDAATVAAALGALQFVRVAEPASLAIVSAAGEYKLVGSDGVTIAGLGPLAAADFAARLRIVLQKVARVQALLALRTDASRADAYFCIGNDLDANAFACSPAVRSDGPVLKLGQRAKLIAVNRAAQPRYLYVFAIDESYAVNLALPDGGGIDSAVAAGKPLVGFGAPDAKGRLTFLTLSSAVPIKASVLEQSGAGARDPAACNASALTLALCAAQQGARDAASPRVGDWTATVASAIIE